MNTKRIEEIQKGTAYPESISVQQALLKVWNECEQEQQLKNCNLQNVSGCSLDELKMLKDHYADRTDRQGKNNNYREAHEDDIRKGTVEHIIAIVNNR